AFRESIRRTGRNQCGGFRSRPQPRATGSGLRSVLHDQAQRNWTRLGGYQNPSGENGRFYQSQQPKPGRSLLSNFPACRESVMKGRILVVEDERAARQALSLLLTDEGYEVLTAADGATARSIALQQEPDLILLDIRLPDMDGLTVLEKLRAGYCDAAVIVMTAYATSSNAIKATQYGAFDYITKPINDEHLILLIRRALEYRTLEHEVSNLKTNTSGPRSIPAIVGHGPAMQDVYKMIGRVANSDAAVL